MPITDHKIKKAPKLHAALAKRHNKLVDLLDRIQGANGISVKKTKGNILITFEPTAMTDGTIPMSVRAINVCVSGVAKQMYILASDPF